MPDITQEPAPIGHNKPPLEEYFADLNADLPQDLQTEMKEAIDRVNELVENAELVPDTISNEEEEGKATDIVSQMKKHRKNLESRRTGIKAGARKAGEIIDGFFKKKGLQPLDDACDTINRGVTAFKRIKAEAEKRKREEAAREAAAEAKRIQAEADAAEDKRREAEAAAARAKAEREEAEAAKRKAIQEAADAEERRKKAEANRIEQERLAAEATSAAAKADALAAAEEAGRQVAEEARKKQEAQEEADRQRQAEADAKSEAALARAEATDARADAKTATKLSNSATGDARKADKAANAKQSDVSGVRGDHGGQSSLTTKWVGDITNREKLDLEKLRPFFSEDSLQKALNAFVKLHKDTQKVKGAKIYETDHTSYR